MGILKILYNLSAHIHENVDETSEKEVVWFAVNFN